MASSDQHVELKIDADLVEKVKQLMKQREGSGTRDLYGNLRVDVHREGEGNGPFLVSYRDFEFYVDEPAKRGGEDKGPNPLIYFLAGGATCYLSHLMLLAIKNEVRLYELNLMARARYNRRAIGGHFTRVEYSLSVETDLDEEKVVELARRAEKMCYVHNTLTMAGVDVITTVHINGREVERLVADTSHIPETK